MQNIYPQVWMALPKEVKLHLVKVFGLVRTGVTEVRDTELVSDGFTESDLRGITLEKMCEYVGSTETFGRAWELTLAKVHSELHPPLGVLESEDGLMVVKPMPEAVQPAEDDVLKVVPLEEGPLAEIEKPWCDTCDSKGVRHKKGCPKFVPVPPRGPASPLKHALE